MEFLFLASFLEVMQYMGYILIAILILLSMITVHELGHYLTGKLFSFGIEEFAIGFGPKLFSKKKKDGEVFSVRLFPLGGFCSFKGEDKDSDDKSAFNNKKPWQRIIVLVSGALMNYLFALLIICLMFGIYGQSALVTYKTMPAQTEYEQSYSFNDKDVILKADGKNIYLSTDLIKAINGKKQGDILDFEVIRNGKKQNVKILLRADADFTNMQDTTKLYSALGIYFEMDYTSGQMQNGGLYTTGVRFGFFETIFRSVDYSAKLAGSIFAVLGELLTGKLGLSSMGGTITTVAVAADVISVGGFRNVLNIASFIGVNLAVFNLLPIPALDGSRAIFTLIEWVRGKPINRRVEGIIHSVGFVLLLVFAIIVDVQQCF